MTHQMVVTQLRKILEAKHKFHYNLYATHLDIVNDLNSSNFLDNENIPINCNEDNKAHVNIQFIKVDTSVRVLD